MEYIILGIILFPFYVIFYILKEIFKNRPSNQRTTQKYLPLPPPQFPLPMIEFHTEDSLEDYNEEVIEYKVKRRRRKY